MELGDWVVGDAIGHGAHSVVHRGHHRVHRDRVVAIKRPVGDGPGPGSDERAALVREAGVLRELSHPAIMPFVDVVDDGDGVAVVMALAEGSLAARIEAEGALPWREVADLGARIASALAVAHGVGVVHRDVTPSNILYGRELEPRLADFGSSLMGGDDQRVVGTPGYLDPAVAAGAMPGPSSDVYGLGVVLYEALAGQPPWAGATPQAVQRAAERGVHLPLSGLAPEAPANLAAIIEQAMDRDPSRRMANAQQLHAALQQVLLTVPETPDADVDQGAVGRAHGRDAARAGPDAANSGRGTAEPSGPDADPGPVDASRPGTPGAGGADSRLGGIGAGRVGDGQPGDAATRPPSGQRPAGEVAPSRPSAVTDDEGATAGSRTGHVDLQSVAGSGRPDPDAPALTTDFGPRPMPPIEVEEPGRPWWMWAALVAAVAIPVGVATWALVVRGADSAPPAGAAATTSAASSPDASAPATSSSATPGAAPPPVLQNPAAAATTAGPHGTPAPTTTPSRNPADWVPRVAAPPCDDQAPRDDHLLADVDGRGCSVPVVIGPGETSTTLRLPPSAGDLQGPYHVDGPPLAVLLGDWDGDGSDTPAVIMDDSGTVFAFSAWGAGDAVEIDEPIGTAAPVVVTDARGRDHVVADQGA